MVIPVEVQMGDTHPAHMFFNGYEITVADIKEVVKTGPADAGFDHYYVLVEYGLRYDIGWLSLDRCDGQWYWEPD